MHISRNFVSAGRVVVARTARLAVIAGIGGGALLSAATADAAVVYPNTTWSTIAGENGNGGSSTITATAPRSGDGSVEMFGDRTRFSLGNYYNPGSNLGLLSTVLGLSYDWMVAGNSTGGYNVDQTPALRLHIFDGGKRSELIWEGVYNGTYGNTSRDTWYSTKQNDLFYQFVSGSGVTLQNGSQVNQTVQSWQGAYSSDAYVSAISVGVGSSFSPNYHAFADNVVFDRTSGSTTYNFEVAASAVPEPGTWAMLLLGFGVLGYAMRRRGRVNTRVQFG